MILTLVLVLQQMENLSRVCGDDPRFSRTRKMGYWFVPRMRGWSSFWHQALSLPLICPAYAGMILEYKGFYHSWWYLSRVCGDDPWIEKLEELHVAFVPRMWGWSLLVILGTKEERNLSRVCGDDPQRSTVGWKALKFVPRMRGWSLFLVATK